MGDAIPLGNLRLEKQANNTDQRHIDGRDGENNMYKILSAVNK